MDRIPSPRMLTIDPNDDNIILEIPEDKDPTAPETPAKKEKVTLVIKPAYFAAFTIVFCFSYTI